MKLLRVIFSLCLWAIAAEVFCSCATDNPDNESSVPWNQPQSWEGPLPSTINQGR